MVPRSRSWATFMDGSIINAKGRQLRQGRFEHISDTFYFVDDDTKVLENIPARYLADHCNWTYQIFHNYVLWAERLFLPKIYMLSANSQV